ncbi:MAG TPA: hypothetical protein VHQ65_09220 [Thermoanaerobaculia bacterium]|nr:hypothetical protein [Thermoanaerobaculia bacterium]
MQGKLFTRDFLDQGIRETDAWRALDDDQVAAFGDELRRLFAAFPVAGQPNEAAGDLETVVDG